MPSERDPAAALNAVLSEVIDLVQDVKQAHRKVPETHALHAVLDEIFADLRHWAVLLMERDRSVGIDPLDSMLSVAGREPPNLWPSAAPDDDVRRVVGAHLDRLADHVSVALSEQDDATSRGALASIDLKLRADREALAKA